MMEVVVVTTGAVRRAKIQQIVTTIKPTPMFFTGTTNSVRALKGNVALVVVASRDCHCVLLHKLAHSYHQSLTLS